MASVELEGVHKTYPNGQVAVRGVDLGVADGELLVLVGPSGCGKSTVLRMVAGLETPTRGRILIGGEDVTGRPPQERDVAMVFQSYALYPHKSVRENLAFGLRMRGVARTRIERRIEEVAGVLGIGALLDRRPSQLSGGQRQRVALGRAIIREPKAFLLDEPLSNLDAKLRVETRAELARLRRRLRATMLYVTHDQEEAMTLGDRIAVIRDGRIEQVAPPLEVYRRPATVFVAGFVGSPAMNLLAASLVREGDAPRVRGGCFEVAWPRPLGREPGSPEIVLGIRPQDLEITGDGAGDASARVDVVETLGSVELLHLVLGEADAEERVTAVVGPERGFAIGARVGVRLPPERLHLFDARTGTRLE